MIDPISRNSAETVTVNEAVGRQTPDPSGPSFSEIVKKGSAMILKAAGGAASFLPDGGLLAATMRGAAEGLEAGNPAASWEGTGTAAGAELAGAAAGTQGSPGGGLTDLERLQQEGFDMNVELLRIQESLSKENRTFSTISNVLKARHETTKTAINNIR